MFNNYSKSAKRWARAGMAGGLTAFALVGSGCGGCGDDDPEVLFKKTYEVGVVCEKGTKPFVPSTEENEGGNWAYVNIACTDGKDVSRPLAVNRNVDQMTPQGFVTVSVVAQEGVEMEVQDSNIRTSGTESTEITVRKLDFDNIDQLGSITVTRCPIPVKPESNPTVPIA